MAILRRKKTAVKVHEKNRRTVSSIIAKNRRIRKKLEREAE